MNGPPSNPPSPAAATPGDQRIPSAIRGSHGQILKSSAVVGGSAGINVLIAVVRTKVLVILLGPAGYGLLGLYTSVADLARTLAGMGINSSGVRQISQAMATGDQVRIARTVTTLRRVALLLGLSGAMLLLIFAEPIWRLSFNAEQRASTAGPGALALLSLAVLFGAVSSGQIALLQGMRRITDLARANVAGAFTGTVAAVVVVWLGSLRGDPRSAVVPSLIVVAFMAMASSWWFSRRIRVEPVRMHVRDLTGEVSDLLKMGFVFMAGGLMTMAVGYIVRLLVMRKLGEAAAGHYHSAYVFAGQYVAFILQAMGADFFPRLTAAAKDNQECNRLVNEQSEVGLLLAGPGVLATLSFAPWIMLVFYSAKFGPAVEILRWICLGMFLRVISWPMGFILLAKGARQAFFWSELLSNAVQVAFVWVMLDRRGLDGTGIAFFAGYVFYLLIIYLIVRKVSGFRWSAENRKLGITFAVLAALVFIGWYHLPRLWEVLGGAFITFVAGILSLRKLCRLVSLNRLPVFARKLLVKMRIAPAQAQP